MAANLTGWKIDIKTTDVPAESEEESEEKEGEEKPKKKAKKAKKDKVGTDGEAEEESPTEVDDATEEKPMENPTEEEK